jgi:hypothetical protein
MLYLQMITALVAAVIAVPQGPVNGPAAGNSYTPAQTKVAILPVIDAAGEKDKLGEQECGILQTQLLKQFQERGFRLIEPTAVGESIKKQNVDLSDEEQRKRATMFALGKDVGADLVAFVLFADKSPTRERDAVVIIKVWLLDVNHEGIIMSAKPIEGKAHGWRDAFNESIQFALKDFMKPYPKVPKKDQQMVEEVGKNKKK